MKANWKDPDYHSKYYLANKEKIKAKSKKNYAINKEARKKQTMGYRETEGYKAIKKQCDKRIHKQRKKSSIVSEEAGVLGTRYTEEEDATIILYKEKYKTVYREIATMLNRSMKGVEYRYNLLRKKREDGDETIVTYL